MPSGPVMVAGPAPFSARPQRSSLDREVAGHIQAIDARKKTTEQRAVELKAGAVAARAAERWKLRSRLRDMDRPAPGWMFRAPAAPSPPPERRRQDSALLRRRAQLWADRKIEKLRRSGEPGDVRKLSRDGHEALRRSRKLSPPASFTAGGVRKCNVSLLSSPAASLIRLACDGHTRRDHTVLL